MARVRNLGNLELMSGPSGYYTEVNIELDRPPDWMGSRELSSGITSLCLSPDGVWRCSGDALEADEIPDPEIYADESWLRQNMMVAPLGKFCFRLAKELRTEFVVGTDIFRDKRYLSLSAVNLPRVERPSVYAAALARKASKIWREVNATST